MTKQLLLVVEDRFQLASLGLVVTPHLSKEWTEKYKFGATVSIEMIRPDGSAMATDARLMWEFQRPGGAKLMCYPKGVLKDDIPIGTEIWVVAPDA